MVYSFCQASHIVFYAEVSLQFPLDNYLLINIPLSLVIHTILVIVTSTMACGLPVSYVINPRFYDAVWAFPMSISCFFPS